MGGADTSQKANVSLWFGRLYGTAYCSVAKLASAIPEYGWTGVYVYVCVCVCLRVFLNSCPLRRVAGNLSIAHWVSEERSLIFFSYSSLEVLVCVWYTIQITIKLTYVVPSYVGIVWVCTWYCFATSFRGFLSWSSGEFPDWSLHKHRFRLL